MKYDKYSPVVPDFYNILKDLSLARNELKVFYFNPEMEIQESKGKFLKLHIIEDGEYLILENDTSVRLDRIITVNEKPGPAFDEYDAFANACLSCQAGYDE